MQRKYIYTYQYIEQAEERSRLFGLSAPETLLFSILSVKEKLCMPYGKICFRALRGANTIFAATAW
jgi:hypothetical protein